MKGADNTTTKTTLHFAVCFYHVPSWCIGNGETPRYFSIDESEPSTTLKISTQFSVNH